MASHRLKRTVRGVLAASAVIAAVSFTPATAGADTPAPTPPPTNDPVAAYTQLSKQADALNEQVNAVNVDLAAKQAQAQRATADVAAARQAGKDARALEDKYRGTVDALTDASFEGARFNQVSALLTGTSARDYLDRATDLQTLATDQFNVLNNYGSAVDKARKAEARAEHDLQVAQDATNAAQALKDQLAQQAQQLQVQINTLSKALSKLSPAQQQELRSTGVQGVFIAPPGVRGAAMTIALNKRGSAYVWAAAGPSTFDCSGLIIYAYAHAGMPGLPHSSAALSTMGAPVSRDDLQPGDLVFFGHPVVHHVGIYVGNGLMVNAPTSGQVVKVEPLFSDYSGARRLGP